MPQIFHRSTNTLAKLSIFGSIFVLLFVTWAVAEINRSSWNTGAFDERQQPVQFSHKHHSGDDGIDCGRDFLERRDTADEDLYELPLANLERQSVSRTGACQLARQ